MDVTRQTAQHLNKTELDDRTLWYDGDSTFDGDRIIELAAKYTLARTVWVDEVTPEIEQYNAMVSAEDKLKIKETCESLDYNWDIPEEFKQLDVVPHIFASEQNRRLVGRQN